MWSDTNTTFIDNNNFFSQALSFFKLLRGFTNQATSFFTTEIDLSALGLGNISIWYIFGVAGLIIFLVAIIVKKVIPLL